MLLVCDYCKKQYKTYIRPRCEKHYCSKECSSKSRSTKVETNCSWCNKKISVRKRELREKNFCSHDCLNEWQKRNKKEFTCKICGNTFYRSPSWDSNSRHKGFYCSLQCRNKDEEWKKKSVYRGNLIQNKKKGLNKLELMGNTILDKLDIHYETQFLVNGKICVDVLIPNKNIIIQWDGDYWHGKNKKYEQLEPRIKKRVDLDRSQDKYLRKCGYKVLRFWEDDVLHNEKKVYNEIKKVIL